MASATVDAIIHVRWRGAYHYFVSEILISKHFSSSSEECRWVHWLRVVYDGRQLDGVNGPGIAGWLG